MAGHEIESEVELRIDHFRWSRGPKQSRHFFFKFDYVPFTLNCGSSSRWILINHSCFLSPSIENLSKGIFFVLVVMLEMRQKRKRCTAMLVRIWFTWFRRRSWMLSHFFRLQRRSTSQHSKSVTLVTLPHEYDWKWSIAERLKDLGMIDETFYEWVLPYPRTARWTWLRMVHSRAPERPRNDWWDLQLGLAVPQDSTINMIENGP